MKARCVKPGGVLVGIYEGPSAKVSWAISGLFGKPEIYRMVEKAVRSMQGDSLRLRLPGGVVIIERGA